MLVEFAVGMFAFLFVMLVGVEMLRAHVMAQVVAEGTRIATREGATHVGTLATPVDPDVFDERYVVLDLDNLLDPAGVPVVDADMDGELLDDLFAVLPPLHLALRSAMIREDREIAGTDRRLLRFPGALVRDPGAVLGRDLFVFVPEVVTEGPPVSVEFQRGVELTYDPATNLVQTTLRYHFAFAALNSRAGPGGTMVFERTDPFAVDNPAILGTFTEVVDYGLGRPGMLGGLFRTADMVIEMNAAARKEVP